MDIIKHPRYQVPRVRAVEILTGFRVRLTFFDGLERDLDLEPYLHGPIFDPIRNDPQMFAAVRVDEEGDTIAWPNGADIAPETLYYDGDPPWAADKKPRRARTAKTKKPHTAEKKASRPRTRARIPA